MVICQNRVSGIIVRVGYRGVAQMARVLASGARDSRFESGHPDKFLHLR